MKLPRRNFLHLAARAASLPDVSRFAWAQAYPTRPVRIIVGFAPGGATDIMARLMGQWLSERLGQQSIVENRPGAASNVAAEPVVNIHREPFVMEVNPSVPVKTVPEFITHAKANAGKINMASAGIGSGNHTAGELFKMMTGVNLVHVPYRGGGPALIDLLGGQVQVMFATMSSSIEYVRGGKL